MIQSPRSTEIQVWRIERLVSYVRNPRKNDAAVDRMCASIREFGFKIPVLARSDGTVVDGHLRLKAARKLGSWPGGDTTSIPVILCDEWTDAQVKAFRLMVNRSVSWASFDDELLARVAGAERRRLRPQPHGLRYEGARRPSGER
jgi:ParB-like chromosome segregation protein Spo0J